MSHSGHELHLEGEEGEVPPEKKNLLHELFGDEESESEDSNSVAEQRTTRSEDKEQVPAVKKSKKQSKIQKQTQPSQKKKKEVEVVTQQPEEVPDTELEVPEGDGLEPTDHSQDFSSLPTFTSSLDIPEEPVAEEQEVQLEEMPYERPPEGAPLYFFKLAGLAIEPKPFDPEFFNMGEDTEGGDEAAARKLKKKSAPTTVRWRYNLDHNQEVIRESNARFVKWSDGSMHLFVGKEAFGVQLQDFKDHHHIFIRQRKDMSAESFLQCHGLLEKKVILNPIDNVAQLKKEALMKMKNAKSLEANRERRQFVASTSDPEKEKKQKEQMESNRSELKRKFGREIGHQEFSADFLEQGADYDEEKEKASEARIIAAKKGHHSSEEEEEYEDDDEDDEFAGSGGEDGEPQKKRSRR